jgi:hypothetical protein
MTFSDDSFQQTKQPQPVRAGAAQRLARPSRLALGEFRVLLLQIGEQLRCRPALEAQPLGACDCAHPAHLHPGLGLKPKSGAKRDEPEQGNTVLARVGDHPALVNFNRHLTPSFFVVRNEQLLLDILRQFFSTTYDVDQSENYSYPSYFKERLRMLDIVFGYGGYIFFLIGFVLMGVIAYIKMNE